MPIIRPHFLSEVQYNSMVQYSRGKEFPNACFDQYIKFSPSSDDPRARKLSNHVLSLLSTKNSEGSLDFALLSPGGGGEPQRVAIQEGMDTMPPLDDAPDWVHRYNEFIWFNQVNEHVVLFSMPDSSVICYAPSSIFRSMRKTSMSTLSWWYASSLREYWLAFSHTQP